jgi:hypothetical protein
MTSLTKFILNMDGRHTFSIMELNRKNDLFSGPPANETTKYYSKPVLNQWYSISSCLCLSRIESSAHRMNKQRWRYTNKYSAHRIINTLKDSRGAEPKIRNR